MSMIVEQIYVNSVESLNTQNNAPLPVGQPAQLPTFMVNEVVERENHLGSLSLVGGVI